MGLRAREQLTWNMVVVGTEPRPLTRMDKWCLGNGMSSHQEVKNSTKKHRIKSLERKRDASIRDSTIHPSPCVAPRTRGDNGL